VLVGRHREHARPPAVPSLRPRCFRPGVACRHDGRVVIPGASDDSDTTGGAAELGGVFTLGVGSSFAQLHPDGTPNENFAPGGITNIGVPPQVDLNAAVLPRPHIAVLAGFVENVGNLYVSRWRLPPSRGAGQQRTQAP